MKRNEIRGNDCTIPGLRYAAPGLLAACISSRSAACAILAALKVDKDVFQAAVLVTVLLAMREFELEEAFAEAGRAFRQKACTGAAQALRLLEQGYPEAARLLMRLTG